jgi:hypothetical protein
MGEDWIAFGAGGPKCKVDGRWNASYAGIFVCGSGDAGIGICWTTHVQSTTQTRPGITMVTLPDLPFGRGTRSTIPPRYVVFSILMYYFNLSFVLFLRRKGNILSFTPNSKVLNVLFIIELNKNQKQPRPTISVPMIYVGMTSNIKLKVLLSTPMLELQYEY